MLIKEKKTRHRNATLKYMRKIRNRAKLLKMVDERARLLWPNLAEALK